MPAPVSVRDDLCRLVALSPGDGRIAGLVRQVCARALSLPSLPCEVAVNEPESPAEAVVAEFAEQFSVDVSAITGEQRSLLWTHLGKTLVRLWRCTSPTLCRGCAPGWKHWASARSIWAG